ncbi:MAG: methyltransferase, partial [Thermodesulfobacteria bacterium]|nr:methyltransferase [Thermodesulfobacteriota bacterium]
MHLSEEKTPKGQTRKSSATSLKKYNLDILQPLEGYRFSVDALLLAEFARVKKRERLIELGAGCGVISMVLARRFPEASIMAVEIQEELFQL